MSFDLYFAGGEQLEEDKLPKSECIGKLFTYALGPKSLTKQLDKNPNFKIFIDSGAFSMYHSNKKIDIDQYIEYINNERGHVSIWAELDVIPWPTVDKETTRISADGSWEKYLYMMERVNDDKRDKLIPVYHFGEPYSHLERILNTEVNGRLAPYIAFGGRYGASTIAIDRSYEHLFNIIKTSKNPNVKVHAFGMTVLELLEKHPFASADSTSWLQTAVNGSIYTKGLKILKISKRGKIDKLSYWGKPQETQRAFKEEIEQMGFTPEELAENYKARLNYNAKYLINWANNYEFKGIQGARRKRLF